jgi:DNA-binding NtrC family response regulator
VRELANAIERAMVVGRPPVIRPEDLPLWNARRAAPEAGDTLADVEKAHVAAILERTGWNITKAAEVLGIDRVTVYNKMRKYGLQREGAGVEPAVSGDREGR